MGLGTDGGMLFVTSARGLGSVAPEKPTSRRMDQAGLRGHEAFLENAVRDLLNAADFASSHVPSVRWARMGAIVVLSVEMSHAVAYRRPPN